MPRPMMTTAMPSASMPSTDTGADDGDEVVGVDEARQANCSGNEQHDRYGKDNAFLISGS